MTYTFELKTVSGVISTGSVEAEDVFQALKEIIGEDEPLEIIIRTAD